MAELTQPGLLGNYKYFGLLSGFSKHDVKGYDNTNDELDSKYCPKIPQKLHSGKCVVDVINNKPGPNGILPSVGNTLNAKQR